MSSRLIVSCLAKNEASKYWKSCIDAWSQFADKILVLDDSSTDETREVALQSPIVTLATRDPSESAWGAESPARALQWQMAMEHSSEGDFIFVLDADMVPANDPRDLLNDECDTYFFALYDLWDSLSIVRCQHDAPYCLAAQECECPGIHRLYYRDDHFWQGHNNARAWMVRRPPDSFVAEWGGRGIHCGHLPPNWRATAPYFAPRDYSLLHYAYADARDREAKWTQYSEVGKLLSTSEFTHAQSILDPNPSLKLLPLVPRWPLQRAT